MSGSVRIEGFDELEAELERLTNPTTRRASARRALRKVAAPLAERVRANAPRDRGRLAESIGYGTRLAPRQARLHRKMFRDDRVAIEMFVGASYALGGGGRHAHLIEFGTGPRYHRNGKYVGHVSPQPFLRPAWIDYQSKMLSLIKAELWADIERTVARAERQAARRAARG